MHQLIGPKQYLSFHIIIHCTLLLLIFNFFLLNVGPYRIMSKFHQAHSWKQLQKCGDANKMWMTKLYQMACNEERYYIDQNLYPRPLESGLSKWFSRTGNRQFRGGSHAAGEVETPGWKWCNLVNFQTKLINLVSRKFAFF